MQYSPRGGSRPQPVPVGLANDNVVVAAIAVGIAIAFRGTALHHLDGFQYAISNLPLSVFQAPRIVPHNQQFFGAPPERLLHPPRPGADEGGAQTLLGGVRDEMLQGNVAEGDGLLRADSVAVNGLTSEGPMGEGGGDYTGSGSACSGSTSTTVTVGHNWRNVLGQGGAIGADAGSLV